MSIDKDLLKLFSIYACKTESKEEKTSQITKFIQGKVTEQNDGSIDSQMTKQTLMLILDLASTKFIDALLKIGYFQDNLFLAE